MSAQLNEPAVLRQTVLLLGDSTVGKSALAQCFASGGVERATQYDMTTTTQLYTASVGMESSQKVELYILETPGQSVFSTGHNGQVGWKDASCVAVVYDVSNTDSFTACAKWLRQVQDMRSGKPLPGVLIANKVDLEADDRRRVSSEEGVKAAAEFHLEYFETSATHAQGVDAPFKHMAQSQATRWARSLQALEEGDL